MKACHYDPHLHITAQLRTLCEIQSSADDSGVVAPHVRVFSVKISGTIGTEMLKRRRILK